MTPLWIYLLIGLVSGVLVGVVFRSMPKDERDKFESELEDDGITLRMLTAGVVLLWPTVVVSYARWVARHK